MSYTASVITVSDLGSRGLRQDTSGPAVRAMLEDAGFTVVHTAIVPDEREQISALLRACADEKRIDLILTTGGTGLSPRDVTPEATADVLEREIRAIPVAMWVEGLKITPNAMLSRAVAGTRGSSLIVNLPGSEKAARENLAAVLSALLRACADERKIDLILTTGGTGLSPRDVTPEATADVLEREIRAIPVAMWVEGLKVTPNAMLSRAVAGTRGSSLIVNLPGSEKAARENLAAVLGALEHALHMIAAEGHG